MASPRQRSRPQPHAARFANDAGPGAGSRCGSSAQDTADLRWTTYWLWCARSLIQTLRALASTAACAVLASATCAIARPRQPDRNTVHSRLMSPDTHIDVKYLPHLPGNEWRMRAAAAIYSWLLIHCPAGDALHRRGARGGDTGGIHSHFQCKNGGQRTALSARSGARLSSPYPHHFGR